MLRHVNLIRSRCLVSVRHRKTVLATNLYARSHSSKSVFVPSAEQTAIVEQCKTRNVFVSARPGVGKTATAEALVQANPDVPIAIVTYSKRLQMETEQRLIDYPNVDTYTFHGLAGRLFGRTVFNDTLLHDLRTAGVMPKRTKIPPYAYVVLDELQDLSEDLYWVTYIFISVITQLAGRAPQVLGLGDARQAIYEFRGADARFLDLAPDVFSAVSPYKWEASELSRSFRLTAETAAFVNNAFLGGEQCITGIREGGPLPLYVHADLEDVPKLLDLLVPLIKKYGPENCAILSPSIRRNMRLSPLTNALTQHHHIPIAVSISDDVPLDPDVVHGKLIVSTYHQFKGSERDLVIVYGADSSYFNNLARSLPDDRCPNATYVALTRARQQLVILQSHETGPMPFVDISALSRYGHVLHLSDRTPIEQEPPGQPLQLGLVLPSGVAAVDAARHVSDTELDVLLAENLHIFKRGAHLPSLNVPDKVLTNATKNHYEAVADLSGLAVTAAFEWHFRGTLSSFGIDKDALPEVPQEEATQAVWFTREAAQFDAAASKYKSRWLQMATHEFDWLVPHLSAATQRLQNELRADGALQPGTDLRFEVPLWRKFIVTEPATYDEHETKLMGRPDIVHIAGRGPSTSVTIWEIKFVSALSSEHVVQAVIYGFLWASKRRSLFPRVVIYNVRDGTRWEISTTLPKASAAIEGVLRAKYTASGPISIDDFLRKCEIVRQEVECVVGEPERPSVKARKRASKEKKTEPVKRRAHASKANDESV